MTPSVRVVLVNWNTRDDLLTCLRSLRQARGVALAISVTDNASTDGSADAVAHEHPEVCLHRSERNLGFGGGGNLAARDGQEPYIMLLNPDSTLLDPDFAPLLGMLESHPEVWIAGIKVCNPDGTVQMSCRRFPVYLAGLFRNTILGRLFPNNRYLRAYLMSDFTHDRPQPVDWVSGCAMVIRRSAWERLEGFDPQFFMYCEDVDLCYRAWQQGGQVWYFPQPVVTHTIGRSSDQAVNAMVTQFHLSHQRLYTKHFARQHGWLQNLLVRMALNGRRDYLLMRNTISDLVHHRRRQP